MSALCGRPDLILNNQQSMLVINKSCAYSSFCLISLCILAGSAAQNSALRVLEAEVFGVLLKWLL